MKKIQYYISALLLMAVVAMSFSSCNDDKLGPTIFPDEDETLDPTSTTYQLDKFIKENYLDKYNLTFLYKLPDISTNMNYNLVPAKYENAVDLAVTCKYLWFDVYDKMAGDEFLKLYAPRIILLVGSSAISSSTREPVDGLTEGGVKITLFNVNSMKADDFKAMNDNYFHTMHREFVNILRLNKTYPTEFNTISVGHYVPSEWRERGKEIMSEGFVSKYASSENTVDFAETIACYITFTDEEWNDMLIYAECGWHKDKNAYCRYFWYPDNDMTQDRKYINFASEETDVTRITNSDGTVSLYYKNERDSSRQRIVVYEVEDEDGIDGKAAIEQKLAIARQWFHEVWNVDLDALRQEVKDRQDAFNMDELRQWVYGIQ